MSYKLQFLPSALREWKKLGDTVREQFKAKLVERMEQPCIEADRLRGTDLKDCYKIKLRTSGYRLVYRVDDKAVTMTVVAAGKRDRSLVYDMARKR